MSGKKRVSDGSESTSKKVKILIRKPKRSIKVSTKTINYCICIPTSILDNCKNLEQITYTAYQIAKSATIFNVGEIVILDLEKEKEKTNATNSDRLSRSVLLASLLQYFVTPPYLVKSVFKQQYRNCFKFAATLPRLAALPFMRHIEEDQGRYREGLSIRMSKPNENSKKEFKQTKFINVGKAEPLELKAQLVPTNVRVTVDTIEGKVVSPIEAYGDFVGAQASYGYQVRIAKTFGDLFTQCSYKDGYSQAVWINSGDYFYNESTKKYHKIESNVACINKVITGTKEGEPTNILLCYGKWDHIAKSFKESQDQFEGCDGAHQFFDGQIELPGTAPQGNITIQDSVMISLSVIQTYL